MDVEKALSPKKKATKETGKHKSDQQGGRVEVGRPRGTEVRGRRKWELVRAELAEPLQAKVLPAKTAASLKLVRDCLFIHTTGCKLI